jgi:16S rRNA (uracil1498-N3)-methyltransferase
VPSSAGAAAQVFVDDLDAPAMTDADAHHLAHVLRLRPGEAVVAADGRGRWRRCVFTGAQPSPAGESTRLLDPDGEVVVVSAPAPAVTVGFVPVKGSRPDWVVQKLTEAGVDRIAVLGSARAVVRWEDGRQAKAIARLTRVAREASAQSRRAWLPEVVAVRSAAPLAARLAPEPLALAHPGGGALGPATTAVAVGPEGGWSDDEVAAFPLVGLGPTVLRAETAALAAGLLLCALRAGVVAPARPAGEAPSRQGPSEGVRRGDSCNHHAE